MSVVEGENDDGVLFPPRVGDRLRAARLAANLDLNDIATRTRVPLRHLEGIEAGHYEGLPSITYCVGFVKAYARAVAMNEAELARDLRVELETTRPDPSRDFVEYEVTDPARKPSQTLAWATAAIVILLVAGFLLWRSQLTADPRDGDTPFTTADSTATEQANGDSAAASDARVTPPATAAALPQGPVVFTANAPVWLRIYEGGGGKRLFEKEMQPGETFTVPADAKAPQLLTGRPQALAVTVGGTAIAQLGPPDRTISDFDISAAALAARPATVSDANARANSGPTSAQP